MAGLAVAGAQSQDPSVGAAVVGQGKYQWRVVPGWGVLDAETPVKDCHAMVQVSDGRIFLLTNHTKNNVIIYDKSGKLLGKWGTEYPGAHGLTLSVENAGDFFYLTDYERHQFYKVSIDGAVERTWDFPEKSGKYTKAEEFKPTHVALAPDGGFFVCDGYGKNWVHRYNSDGEWIAAFGGDEPDGRKLACAHGAWVDTRDGNNLLWVTSRNESKVKRFTMAGKPVDEIEFPGARPNFIVPFGEFTMVPHLKGNQGAKEKIQSGFVSVLGPDLKVVANIGAPAADYVDGKLQPMGSDTKLFTNPHGILIDDEGSVYVAQWNSGATYPIKLERVKG